MLSKRSYSRLDSQKLMAKPPAGVGFLREGSCLSSGGDFHVSFVAVGGFGAGVGREAALQLFRHGHGLERAAAHGDEDEGRRGDRLLLPPSPHLQVEPE